MLIKYITILNLILTYLYTSNLLIGYISRLYIYNITITFSLKYKLY